jgi:hypothetical protein
MALLSLFRSYAREVIGVPDPWPANPFPPLKRRAIARRPAQAGLDRGQSGLFRIERKDWPSAA